MNSEIERNPFAKSTKFADKYLHLGISGSIACYRSADLLRDLLKIQMRVSVTLTSGARHFVTSLLFRALGAEPVYGEMFGDERDVFGHLEPGEKADALAIVPASANIIAKLANGLADDMLSAQALAFPGKPLIAPAMNPRMWAHGATRDNIQKLLDRGALLVPPGTGLAACGDEGQGRLAAIPEIFLGILKALSPQDMQSLRVMVTMGPTREKWDGVRFWSNPSSGLMGCALATAAWLRGAEVTAICGPGLNVYLPGSVRRINVTNAKEMLAEAEKIWPDCSLGLFSAAVSDFMPERPENADSLKVKKKDLQQKLSINFSANPDIIKTLCQNKRANQKALGFAAEITPDMQSLLPLALGKLNSKNADIIAANRVNPGSGAFGSDMDSMAIIDKAGHSEIWDAQSKADIAWDLCTWLLRM